MEVNAGIWEFTSKRVSGCTLDKWRASIHTLIAQHTHLNVIYSTFMRIYVYELTSNLKHQASALYSCIVPVHNKYTTNAKVDVRMRFKQQLNVID